ncbi:hypothetical protein F2P81_012464 [Scophthalmus maximus]|uniref:Uncharacterized protein n=1 Tax=Scophthalmus maximus TaxID=52904 RepID=A0A6A4SHR7_SCOMX|nr:hypothetical protein F2P81_012464 [Scophthalmus maximus]
MPPGIGLGASTASAVERESRCGTDTITSRITAGGECKLKEKKLPLGASQPYQLSNELRCCPYGDSNRIQVYILVINHHQPPLYPRHGNTGARTTRVIHRRAKQKSRYNDENSNDENRIRVEVECKGETDNLIPSNLLLDKCWICRTLMPDVLEEASWIKSANVSLPLAMSVSVLHAPVSLSALCQIKIQNIILKSGKTQVRATLLVPRHCDVDTVPQRGPMVAKTAKPTNLPPQFPKCTEPILARR